MVGKPGDLFYYEMLPLRLPLGQEVSFKASSSYQWWRNLQTHSRGFAVMFIVAYIIGNKNTIRNSRINSFFKILRLPPGNFGGLS